MTEFVELFVPVLTDAALDTAKMLPFLLGAYLLMEYLEHRASHGMTRLLSGAKAGPVVGALLGCLPQCGFSVAAANLYAGGVISTGTLVAVFIATSDEAVPLLLGHPDSWGLIWRLLPLKLALGIVSGIIVDLMLRSSPTAVAQPHSHHHEEQGLFRTAVSHTINTGLFLLAANLIIGGAVELLGQERLAALLLGDSIFQPLVASIIGLIPNCAASVLLTTLHLEGALSFGSLVAGLSTGAGVGLMVLYRSLPSIKDSLRITGLLVGIGTVAGIIIQLVM